MVFKLLYFYRERVTSLLWPVEMDSQSGDADSGCYTPQQLADEADLDYLAVSPMDLLLISCVKFCSLFYSFSTVA